MNDQWARWSHKRCVYMPSWVEPHFFIWPFWPFNWTTVHVLLSKQKVPPEHAEATSSWMQPCRQAFLPCMKGHCGIVQTTRQTWPPRRTAWVCWSKAATQSQEREREKAEVSGWQNKRIKSKMRAVISLAQDGPHKYTLYPNPGTKQSAGPRGAGLWIRVCR